MYMHAHLLLFIVREVEDDWLLMCFYAAVFYHLCVLGQCPVFLKVSSAPSGLR